MKFRHDYIHNTELGTVIPDIKNPTYYGSILHIWQGGDHRYFYKILLMDKPLQHGNRSQEFSTYKETLQACKEKLEILEGDTPDWPAN